MQSCTEQHALPYAARQIAEQPRVDPCTFAGLVGVGLIVAAYFASQQGWLDALDWRFPAANLVGSLLILTSLYTAWNFPSVVIEVIWSAISLYGLGRHLLRRRRGAAGG